MNYIGIDDRGQRYEVIKINWANMTALCESEAWIGWQRCRFEKFEEQETITA